MHYLDEVMRAWQRGERPIAPVTKLLGIRLLDYSPGAARLEMDAGTAHHNPMGTVHGGIIGDLADAAFGGAMATALADGETFTTLDLHVRFFRAVREGRLTAEAELVRRGKNTVYLECEVIDSDGELVAKATSTCLLMRGRPMGGEVVTQG